jgi:hypothetical protein
MGEKRKMMAGRHAISYTSDTYIMETLAIIKIWVSKKM